MMKVAKELLPKSSIKTVKELKEAVEKIRHESVSDTDGGWIAYDELEKLIDSFEEGELLRKVQSKTILDEISELVGKVEHKDFDENDKRLPYCLACKLLKSLEELHRVLEGEK